MIKRIWVNGWSNYSSNKTEDVNYIELGKLNLFIGRNNSGKSWLLRKLYESTDDDVHTYFEDDNFDQYLNCFHNLSTYIPRGTAINGIHGDLLADMQDKKNPFLLINRERQEFTQLTSHANRLRDQYNGSTGSPNINGAQDYLKNFYSENKKQAFEDLNSSLFRSHKIYIPILRGMRPLGQDGTEPYKTRTWNDYFREEESLKEGIFTGEGIFKLLREYLLGLPEQREKIKKYEILLSRVFFNDKEITLIPKHDSDVVNIKIGDEDQLPIYFLGDGLQQIIIITSAAYLSDTSQMIIEEPENCLHPGYLRQLFKFLLDETPHQFFITTHSNHALEFSDERTDTLIHKVSKIEDGGDVSFNIDTVSRDRGILIDLGVKSSSIYLANCTIWVEGVTDRLYIKAFLNKYISKLKSEKSTKYDLYSKYMENYHYSFIEYQGGNLSHWFFGDENGDFAIDELNALSVSTPVFLIADGDIKNKGDRVNNMREQLGDDFYLLGGKEIENLIPDNIVKVVAREIFEGFTRDTFGKNIDDIDSLSYEKYVNAQNGIGYFIDRCFGLKGKGKDNERIFADISGTIKDKGKFCDITTKIMMSEEWTITEQVEELCRKILEHIEKNNEV